ncbi:MAG: hypothetical protein ACXWU6_15925 [Allosphingosinicella sp.]
MVRKILFEFGRVGLMTVTGGWITIVAGLAFPPMIRPSAEPSRLRGFV